MHWWGLHSTLLLVLVGLAQQDIHAASSTVPKVAAIAEDEPAERVCLIQRTSAAAPAKRLSAKAAAWAAEASARIHKQTGWPATPAQLPELLIRAASSEEKAATNKSHSPRAQHAPAAKDGLRTEVLEGSIAVLQESIARQSSLERENRALHTKATQAQLQVSRMTAADRELLHRDDQLRLEDDRMRQQDEELRRENARLEQAIAQLTRGATTPETSADAGMNLALILSALLPSNESLNETQLDTGNNRTTSTNSTSKAASIAAKLKKRKAVLGLLISGALLLSFVIYVAIQAIMFFGREKCPGEKDRDGDGDGDVDWDDFQEYMAEKICCGLSANAAKSVLFVIVIAVGGFAFLWWQGIIQPFLQELACYLYVGVVILALAAIVVAELWSSVYDKFSTQIHRIEKLAGILGGDAQGVAQDIFGGGVDENGVPRKSAFGCC